MRGIRQKGLISVGACVRVAAACIAAAASVASQAAEFSVVRPVTLFNRTEPEEDRQPVVMVSGPIVKGDVQRFIDFVNEQPKVIHLAFELSLDSPGGNLREAIELARLVRRIGFGTRVEPSASCLSACFVVYVAGYMRQGQSDSSLTSIPGGSTIGVHRGFIAREQMSRLSPEEARSVVKQTATVMKGALEEFDVPPSVIEAVNNTPAAGVRFLTRKEVASLGSPDWVEDLAHAKCGLRIPSDNASAGTIFTYEREHALCLIKAMLDGRQERIAAVAKLRPKESIDFDALLGTKPRPKSSNK